MNAFCLLLAEDNENDVFLRQRAFAVAEINQALPIVAMDSGRSGR